MNFLEKIFHQLAEEPERLVLREMQADAPLAISGANLRRQIGVARRFLRGVGLKPGDRCGLLAPNGIRWVALDLAMMAEGLVVVPLYSRQAPGELAFMLRDCGASAVCCANEQLRDGLAASWPNDRPALYLFDQIFSAAASLEPPEQLDTADTIDQRAENSVATIIYTSGTSGEPKGVMLTIGNLDHMVPCTGARLDQLMESRSKTSSSESTTDQIFHYLPFCFAGSWILMLTALSRKSLLSLSMDLNRLADELKAAEPNYFLNVPTLLERIRTGVESSIAAKPALIRAIYARGRTAWERGREGQSTVLDRLWLAIAKRLIFDSIRRRVGPGIEALICGSAPLAKETQLFFLMIGIRVLQVYGLTETTAICTMDDPRRFTPGRVGPAIPGIEMKIDEGGEILVRGPHIFAGYWNRPETTAAAMRGEWFRTGDQGELDAAGNWSIVGRIKNLLILNSGHNVAPEPIEEKILAQMHAAQQCVIIGNDRSFLTAIVTGEVTAEAIQAAIDSVNRTLPHYKRVLGFHHRVEPLTIESGLLTANGKIRRDAVAAEFAAEIDRIYMVKKS
jgi:long-chain acyl-CoA synthetase